MIEEKLAQGCYSLTYSLATPGGGNRSLGTKLASGLL